MSLIRLENIALAFGEAPLLDNVNLQIEGKERIFLIGRNGIGKSCLFKIITGELKPDHGRIFKNPGLKIGALSQELPFSQETTVYDVVAEGLEDLGRLLKEFHHLTQMPSQMSFDTSAEPSLDQKNAEAKWLKDLETVQKQIEERQGWEYQQTIDTILTKLELPPDKKLNTLSGGWQRRALLARALVSNPDLLLLDEPTNHLDLEAIQWLEEFLDQYPGAVLCITHDRALLRKLSNRILELDRGKLTSWNGDYDQYLADREHRLMVEDTHAKLFDKKLAQEEAWIRQGIKARRTRNEGRVRALEKLRDERAKRRELQGKPQFAANEQIISGDLVIDAENISYQIHQLCLVKDFSIKIYRGDKIALIGANGVGKSTLLKILLGQLSPDQGTVKLGTKLQIGYFDQLRGGINPELSAIENVAGGRETILINGIQKHIVSYLSDFLFIPDRIRMPVKLLSGGENNRLLLAKLFSLPTNLLVMDEPTNDLDIESLELLESILVDYAGTLLLVSHDRTFVDEVATSTLYFSGQGKITEFVGGYKDIPAQVMVKQILMPKENVKIPDEGRKTSSEELNRPTPTESSVQAIQSVQSVQSILPQKGIAFTSKMKKELEELPNKIATLEVEQHQLQEEMAKPEFYSQEKSKTEKIIIKFGKVTYNLAQLYARWEELENLKR